MDRSPENRPVLVAVANPEHAEQLVRTASDLARLLESYVTIVSVAVKPSSSPFSVYTDETIIERFAQDTRDLLDAAIAVAPEDVPIEREIVVGRTMADGVLKAIRRTDARALVIGWHDSRSRTDAILGTNLDNLIENAPCDLYVERIGYEANGVDSILVPVAGGPHVRPATHAAKAIAARNDATVHLLSIVEPDIDEGAARDHLEAGVQLLEDSPGSGASPDFSPDVRVETAVRTGDDVSATIAELAPDHDVLVFGVTRQGAIQRRLVGSIPQRVIPRIDETVILARSGDVVSPSRLDKLRGLWRRG
ncbi:universal stress protein [Natronosalvus rutilus]|uniref:Universal stress protein n=1 Tax=Natronosalvus rutilus TaxID=2953753 RepID=A0A9E7N9Z6_9EURY|nr:universal stress protein [Natronosalvus rutilus]UTF53194.1 universal stress protein [Natronosalvus rutilus]